MPELRGRGRTAVDLLKKLKTVYVEARHSLQSAQVKFSKARWVLFYQPERVTPERARLLFRLLAQYPELQPYRDLTLRVGSIYRLPLAEVKPEIIDGLVARDDYGPEVRAAIAT